MFNRISGTTAISGAVDSSFTLVEEQRGSGRARLSCIGRDIGYRELELCRNADNVWEVTADSYQQPELLGGRIVSLLSALLQGRPQFIGTPTELAQLIDPAGAEGITPKNVSRKILQSVEALRDMGITALIRRSNGKRLVDLRRADSADHGGAGTADPIDPAGAPPCVQPCEALCVPATPQAGEVPAPKTALPFAASAAELGGSATIPQHGDAPLGRKTHPRVGQA